MKLSSVPFKMTANGDKTIEARLYDSKRRGIDLGDTIVFRHLDNENQAIEAKVIGLLRYETFGDMFAHNDPHKFGGDSAESLTAQMLEYYSQIDQDEHGVLGIEIALG
jgi:ASC-1-like (ASCH) protein